MSKVNEGWPLRAPLLPAPRECVFEGRGFVLDDRVRIFHPLDADAADRRAASNLADELKRWTGIRPRRIGVPRYVGGHLLYLGREPGFEVRPGWVPEDAEGYGIESAHAGVLLAGRDAAGLYYAVATFAQVLRLRRIGGAKIPAFHVRDRPRMRWRGVMIDVGRQVERPDFLDRFIRDLAAYKKNMIVLYFEDKYRWRTRPELSHVLGYTEEDFARLAKTAAEHHMEFVPAPASLGHCEGILRHPSLAHLREERSVYQLSLRHRGTRALLRSLYGELLSLYPGRFFHVNCDESPLLAGPPGAGRSYFRESLRRFREHLVFLHDFCARHGKRIMVWGDMLLHHPQILENLPRDIVVVDWEYGPVLDQPRAAPAWFRERGFEVIVAPAAGRSASVGVMPSMQMADNVPGFIRLGYESGACGEMATMWEMFSTNPLVLRPGLVASAACGWDPVGEDPVRLPGRVAEHCFGPEAADAVVTAWRELSGEGFMRRYRNRHGGPEVAGYRTYHIDSHELVPSDPMVYLTYREDPWAESVAGDAAAGLKHLQSAIADARWNRENLEAFEAGGLLQRFQGELRCAINRAGRSMLAAARAGRKHRLDEAARHTATARVELEQLRELASKLGRHASRIWRRTRHPHDPALEDIYLRRLRFARRSLSGHIRRLKRLGDRLDAGESVALDASLGNQDVLFYDAFNPSRTLIDIWSQRVEASDDGESWTTVLTKGWFILSRQHYAVAQILPGGWLPRRLRLATQRLHIDPVRYPMEERLRIRVARTLSPGAILDGPPGADFETSDLRLIFRRDVEYTCFAREGLAMEYRITRK